MTSVRKLLARYAFHPQKRLGQSFLEDRNIIRRIVALAEPAGDETVVEIGAGLGSMTEELAKRTGRLIALEVELHGGDFLIVPSVRSHGIELTEEATCKLLVLTRSKKEPDGLDFIS